MASYDEYKPILVTLQALPGVKWEPGISDRYYSGGLAELDAGIMTELNKRIANKCDKRPSRAEILKLAAEIASPLPAASDALDECLSLVRRFGRNGRRVGDTDIYREGAPPFSHPIINRVVSDLGGWGSICETENIGVFRAQFERFYGERVAQWREEVADALALPAGERPLALFPVYQKPSLAGFVRLALPASERLALPAPAAPNKRAAEDARTKIESLSTGKALPSTKGKG
jgi:hypothetical protein